MSTPIDLVECYSGSSYPQRPRAFTWQGEAYPVAAVVREAFTPKGKEFTVQTAEGLWFNLAYTAEIDQWQISKAYLPETPRRSW